MEAQRLDINDKHNEWTESIEFSINALIKQSAQDILSFYEQSNNSLPK